MNYNKAFLLLAVLGISTTLSAQDTTLVNHHHKSNDSTDVFYRHLQLNELVVTGVTGDTKLRNATAPVSIVSPKDLRATASTNIIDAIAHQPGISQLTTGSGISKPIIRGLGYNRVVVMSEGVRQEGQQWGDEHGVEVDAGSVNSVEILKGPASLMYGSDAMAGVVILHSQPTLPEGSLRANVSTEYQTNNQLFAYSLSMAGNQQGFVWDARFTDKKAQEYQNQKDGHVPGSQFLERSGRLMLGVNKQWGHSRLTWVSYHLKPHMVSFDDEQPFQQIRHYKLVWDNSLNLHTGYLKAIVGYQQNRRQEFEEDGAEPELYMKLHTMTYDLRYLTKEWQGWKWSIGVNGMYQQSVNKGEEFLIPDYRLFDFGIYTTASRSLGAWTLNGGLRYDHRRIDARHFNGITGSIGTVWNMNDHLNLRFNLARGFRTPNMSELASDGVHEGSYRYELGNYQLKAEYSMQADLGLDFTSRFISAQVALFANHIDNYIFLQRSEQVIDPDYHTYVYTQSDARLLGFECGVDLHPIHSVHFANTFSYVNAQLLHQPEDTRHLPFTPAPRWTSELKWELTHHAHSTINHDHTNHHHFQRGLSLNNTYLYANIECYLSQSNIHRANGTETVTPSYTLASLSAGTDILIGQKKVAEFYVTANNLFNRVYQSHLSRLKYIDNPSGQQGVYNMGRNVTLKLVIPIQF